MTAKAFPEFTFHMELPTWPEEMITARDHNKFAKQAIRETMEEHVKKNLRRHFERGARERYRYAPRDPRYVLGKSRKFPRSQGRDLVKTGRSRLRILHRGTIRTPGTAVNGTLRVVYKSAFDFRGGTGRFRKRKRSGLLAHQQISIEQMRSEVKRIIDQEAAELAKMFKAAYMKKVEQKAKSRKRKKKSFKRS
jgi:hypothetical protein